MIIRKRKNITEENISRVRQKHGFANLPKTLTDILV